MTASEKISAIIYYAKNNAVQNIWQKPYVRYCHFRHSHTLCTAELNYALYSVWQVKELTKTKPCKSPLACYDNAFENDRTISLLL